MTIEIYKGGEGRPGESYVRIDPAGHVYLSAAISSQMQLPAKQIEVGYDAVTGVLVLYPACDDGGQRYRVHRDKGGMRASMRGPLNYWNLRQRAIGKHPARWADGKIWVTLRGVTSPVRQAVQPQEAVVTPDPEPGDLPLATRADPAVHLDLLDAQAVARLLGCTLATLYNRLSRGVVPAHACTQGKKHLWRRSDIERCTAAPGPPAPATKQPPSPPAPVELQARTCSNCADGVRLGRNYFCRSDSSEHHNTKVEVTDTCVSHRRPGSYRPPPRDEEE